MNEFNREACDIRKEQVNKTLERHEQRLNVQDEKLDDITKIVFETTSQVKMLNESVLTLVSTLKWAIGIVVTIMIAYLTLTN